MKTIFHISFLFFIACQIVYANGDPLDDFVNFKFEKVPYESETGLAHATNIRNIQMDKGGIFWVASNKGLYRYNGYAATNVSKIINAHQREQIDFGVTTGIIIDHKNNLWISSWNGLFHLEVKTMKCAKIYLDEPLYKANYRNSIEHLYLHNKTLYIGSANGLYLVDIETEKVIDKYLTDGNLVHNYRKTTLGVYSIYPEISPSYLWVVVSTGIYKIDKKTKEIESWSDERHEYPTHHALYKGQLLGNKLLMPSYFDGMVEFNLETHQFTNHLQPNTHRGDLNCILSALPINDSIMVISSSRSGIGLFNRQTKTYQWIAPNIFTGTSTPNLLSDNAGHVWTSSVGHLYRSTTPISTQRSSINHSLDISSIYSNNKKIHTPCFDGYDGINLAEGQQNIEIVFSLTQHFLFKSVEYQLKVNHKNWITLADPNHLLLFNLSAGKNKINIRAKSKGIVIAERAITFNLYIPFYKSKLFYLLLLVILIGIGYWMAKSRIKQVRKEEKQRSSYEKKLAEIENMALRSQINPHFIFNTLNSIKYYSISKGPAETGDFINKFSVLIRQILENSKKNLITLREEIETLDNYIAIEKLRFRDAFDSTICIDPAIDKDFFMIPPMLIQPFIENAIWHGLMHKDGNKKLDIHFVQKEETIICKIIDNGVGRKAAGSINKTSQHKSSLGMSITQDRIENLYLVHGIKSDFKIIDLYDDQGDAVGTKVVIRFT